MAHLLQHAPTCPARSSSSGSSASRAGTAAFGSPAPGVNADNFSIRWTNTSNAVGGTYRVSIKTDDGARVFVDGVQVLNAWQVQAASRLLRRHRLAPGWHTWTIEYFEQTGVAEFCFNARKL